MARRSNCRDCGKKYPSEAGSQGRCEACRERPYVAVSVVAPDEDDDPEREDRIRLYRSRALRGKPVFKEG